MRIATSPFKQNAPPAAAVPPVHAEALSPEISKALIAGGIFNHDPNHVVWSAPGSFPGSVGLPIGTLDSVRLGGGIDLQPRLMPKEDERVSKVLRDVHDKTVSYFQKSGFADFADSAEKGGFGLPADGLAFVTSVPLILESLVSDSFKPEEKFILYTGSVLSLLNIANTFSNIPYAEVPLQVLSVLFKVKETVYMAGIRESGTV